MKSEMEKLEERLRSRRVRWQQPSLAMTSSR
jgi:hypothetical protein